MLASLKIRTIAAIDSASKKTPDEALVASIAAGDKRAMERLFARYSQPVYHFIYRLTHNASLAEDLVSEVFLAVWRSAGNFEAKSRVSTWLLAIARNKAFVALRRRTEAQLDHDKAAAIVDDSDGPEIKSHCVSRNAIIQRCLTRLSPGHREVIDLVYYHGKTVAETALIVGIPEGTVKTRMMTARRRLAELLKGAGLDQFEDC